MDIRPLHKEQDYDWAIRAAAHYFEIDPALGTADGNHFEVLSILIKDYEDKHFATSCGDPVPRPLVTTFETCRPTVAMSVLRGRAEVVGAPQTDANHS